MPPSLSLLLFRLAKLSHKKRSNGPRSFSINILCLSFAKRYGLTGTQKNADSFLREFLLFLGRVFSVSLASFCFRLPLFHPMQRGLMDNCMLTWIWIDCSHMVRLNEFPFEAQFGYRTDRKEILFTTTICFYFISRRYAQETSDTILLPSTLILRNFNNTNNNYYLCTYDKDGLCRANSFISTSRG